MPASRLPVPGPAVVHVTTRHDLTRRARTLAWALAALLLVAGLLVAQAAGAGVPLDGERPAQPYVAAADDGPTGPGRPTGARLTAAGTAAHRLPADVDPLPGIAFDPLHPGAEHIRMAGQLQVLHWSGTRVTEYDVAASTLGWGGDDGIVTITPGDEGAGCLYLENGGPGQGRLTVALMLAALDEDGEPLTVTELPAEDMYWHAQHVDLFWEIGGDGCPDSDVAGTEVTHAGALESSGSFAEILSWQSKAVPANHVVLAQRTIARGEVVPVVIGFRMDCSVGSDAPRGVCEHGSDGIGEELGKGRLRFEVLFFIQADDVPTAPTGRVAWPPLLRLPRTGAEVLGLLLAAGALAVAGSLVVVAARRRRKDDEARLDEAGGAGT